MKDKLKAVEDFHKAFGQPVNYKPTLVDSGLANLRFKLMKEENEEYIDAVENEDLTGIADALGDQLYILCGTILTHGMQDIICKCFNEIQESNMSKLDENGKAIINGENGVWDDSRPAGKILKSKNYTEPNLSQFLVSNKYGNE